MFTGEDVSYSSNTNLSPEMPPLQTDKPSPEQRADKVEGNEVSPHWLWSYFPLHLWTVSITSGEMFDSAKVVS